MNQLARSLLRACLSALFGMFCLPALLYGAYLLFCWFRIHTSDVYYANYSYFSTGLVFICAGLLSLYATWFGAWRRSLYGLLFLVPVFLGVAAMVLIPCMPPRGSSMGADANYLSGIRSFIRVWYENEHRFPASEVEFRDALAKGPAAWQDRVAFVPTSEYRKGSESVPYEIVVETDATGPRLQDMSQRPGVIYYRVSQDLQEFWVTMTVLQTDFSSTASLLRMSGQPTGEVLVIHAAGNDYQ